MLKTIGRSESITLFLAILLMAMHLHFTAPRRQKSAALR